LGSKKQGWRSSGKSRSTRGGATGSRKSGRASSVSRTSVTLRETSSGQSTWLQEDPPVSPSRRRGDGWVTLTRGGSGRSSSGSFARFDPATSSWKTLQGSLTPSLDHPVVGSALSSRSWPRAGMTRSGTASRLRPLVPRIYETEFGYWPTPTKAAEAPNANSNKRHGPRSLLEVARFKWPTPSKSNANEGEGLTTWDARREKLKEKHRNGNGVGEPLAKAVQREEMRRWPTPIRRDSRTLKGAKRTDKALGTDPLVVEVAKWPTPTRSRRSGLQSHGDNAILGKLNPQWVAWLMGLPVDYVNRPEGDGSKR